MVPGFTIPESVCDRNAMETFVFSLVVSSSNLKTNKPRALQHDLVVAKKNRFRHGTQAAAEPTCHSNLIDSSHRRCGLIGLAITDPVELFAPVSAVGYWQPP